MKKILSLVLVMALAASLLTAAFAEAADTKLCDETTTLTVLTYDAASNTMPAPSNDLPFWAWLEEATNVHVEWEVIPNASYSEVLSARLSAGESLADVTDISGSMLRQAGLNGVIVDLAGYYGEEYTPNLVAYFADDPMNYQELITTPEGNIWGLYGTINPSENRITALYNHEWMEAIGAEIPTTLDEFYDLLVKISEAGDLNGNGEADEIPLSSASCTNVVDWLGLAFGTHSYEGGNNFQVDAEGKVYDERLTEAKKNTLAYINKLFTEGLLDPEICETGYDIMSQKNAANRVGVMIMYSSFAPAYGAMTVYGADDPLGEHLSVGPALKSEYNGNTAYMYRNENLADAAAVSATSENIELAIRWLDFLIASEPALTTRCWGFEGETFEYDESGNKTLIQPADGGKWNINPYGCGQIALPHLQTDEQLQNPDSNLPWYIDQCNALKANSTWFGPAIPNVQWTEAENELNDMSRTDVNTYWSEMRNKFIKGDEDIEAQWDTFVSNMYGLGDQNLIDANQSVYDRTIGAE